jgi:hypothetical protein
MSLDYKTDLAKQEYVDAINNINEKYDLPLTIVEILLNAILLEVSNMKIVKIQEEKIKAENEVK